MNKGLEKSNLNSMSYERGLEGGSKVELNWNHIPSSVNVDLARDLLTYSNEEFKSQVIYKYFMDI